MTKNLDYGGDKNVLLYDGYDFLHILAFSGKVFARTWLRKVRIEV